MVPCGILAALCLACSLVLIRKSHPAGKAWMGAAATLFFLAAVLQSPHTEDEKESLLSVRLPEVDSSNGYVSSQTCVECHADEHSSWSGSYHSRMTQVVSPETMAAPAEESHFTMHGRQFRFLPEKDRFLIETVDLEWDDERRKVGLEVISENEKPPRVRRQIVMSTGSHHYQTYWINGTQGNRLWRAPWVYHIQLERWIPLLDTFLVPPINHRNVSDWNDNCIHCHSTGGEPGLENTGAPATRVGELGIACEACHGPGQKHVEHQRALRKAGTVASLSDSTIVNPARLSHQRSAEVCGQCHSANQFDSLHRKPYLPGERLEDAITLHRFQDEAVQRSRNLRDSFWADGTMRVAGRDFSSLETSACYQQGEISCLSCHSMHGYESPDDQLGVDMRSDAACLQCHETVGQNISAHTHHGEQSVGSRCMNCHMPHASFGLFKAIRSHRIDSPTTAMTLQHGRPNACVLCHVDRTTPWIDARLVEWYGHEKAKVSEMAEELSPAVAFLISGDAVQRAVLAWNFGREESRLASGDDWQIPLLAELLDDPYSVVRAVAARSIRQFPGEADFQYDFLAPVEERRQSRDALLKRWNESRPSGGLTERLTTKKPAELVPLMLKPSGGLDANRLKKLKQFRDDREIYLAE